MQDLYSHGTFTGLSTVKRILQRLKTCLFFSLQLWCHFVNTIPSLKEISNFHRKKTATSRRVEIYIPWASSQVSDYGLIARRRNILADLDRYLLARLAM